MTAQALTVEELSGGRIAKIVLNAGKGNILTGAVIREFTDLFGKLGANTRVRAVVLTAVGKHFSFGASVPEHVPGEVEKMLPAFSELFRKISGSALPICVAVRGSCLGGGLELALAAHHIVVADDAKLGVPEVTLGVFPPLAAAVLPFRVSQPTADRLVGTGEIIDGTEAVRVGLADQVCPADAVEAEALKWAERYLDLSGVAVRYATRAARSAWDDALKERLDSLEKLYLGELMATEDAKEGIKAFMERRKPEWVDR